MDKKGFLFTVTIFLVLTYVLLSISVWVKSIEASERGFSEFFKESTVELTIEQITPQKMDNVTNILMNRALYRLDEHTVNFPVKPADGDELENIRLSLFSLFMNGNASASYFKGNTAIPTEANSSMNAWKDNLNASLRAIGVEVDEFNVTNFRVNQSDIDKVNYSMDIKLGIRDLGNVSRVSRTYKIANEIDISGFVDPALARLTKDEAGDNQTVYRQFFFDKTDYANFSTVTVNRMGQSVQGGQGWIYGYLTRASGTADAVPVWYNVSPNDRPNFILVGTYAQITAIDPGDYQQFGGYILTDSPTLTNTSCGYEESNTFNPIKYGASPTCTVGIDMGVNKFTSKPFIVAPGFNTDNAPDCPLLDGSWQTRKCTLMLNTYNFVEVKDDWLKKHATTGSGLYEVEVLRDFVMCGYYTHNPKAPSYLQRLLNDTYARSSAEFGIESFVVGNYANDYDAYDLSSRLDRELFNGSISGIKIRGLPGCRNFATCADSPVTGIFAVSDDTKTDYGLDQIACDSGAAGCD
ncbi:MAG TPA: hypothetical protein VLD37_05540 [Candidatus Bilamarchaeum sp.]|nr:hypothetical protein [Candidatus Bilamarchaeum sp.]